MGSTVDQNLCLPKDAIIALRLCVDLVRLIVDNDKRSWVV